ncbi:MAG: hypothetical protein RIC56_20600 [Pseudomonadales bacterium]
MKDLVGRSFTIADGRYRIVDVRRLVGDAMVYAERLEGRCAAPPARADGSSCGNRTAFHYDDIAALLDAPSGT